MKGYEDCLVVAQDFSYVDGDKPPWNAGGESKGGRARCNPFRSAVRTPVQMYSNRATGNNYVDDSFVASLIPMKGDHETVQQACP